MTARNRWTVPHAMALLALFAGGCLVGGCGPAPSTGDLVLSFTDLASEPWDGPCEVVAETDHWRFRGRFEGETASFRGVPTGEIRLRVVSRDPARNHRFEAPLWIREGDNEATLTMVPGGSVSGRVVDSNGAPAGDVEIRLVSLHADPPPPGPGEPPAPDPAAIAAAPSTMREVEATARSDAEGRFRFDWTRPGAKELAVGESPARPILVEAETETDAGDLPTR